MEESTREPQYQICLDLRDRKGLAQFGLMSNQVWHDDPKRIVFMLSRYKFVAKMLSGMERVLEVGCADAFGTRVVQQEVKHVTAVDFDPVFVEDARARMDERWPFDCQVHDMLEGPVGGQFDAAYALDVLEHIPPEHEERFLSNIIHSLKEHGVLIIGIPSIQSQVYASAPSKEGHVNCKDYPGLKALMSRFFQNVFIFSMNDEVVHTGFYPMAHYLFALCTSRKS
ncbi:MAG TPA: class I SAM-dependent methyltransferase [Pyrinomonadaceae bacterium]|jgi:SAM-dependent methyltransferase